MRKSQIKGRCATMASEMHGVIMAFEHRPMESGKRNDTLVSTLKRWKADLVRMSPSIDQKAHRQIEETMT